MARTTTAGPKATAEVAARFTTLPDNFLDCRDPGLRHAWMRLNNFHVVGKQRKDGIGIVQDVRRESVCGRCEAVKTEHFYMSKTGLTKYRNSYHYQEGYLLAGIPRGVTPSLVIYQEQYRRAMEEVAHAAAGERETAER